MLRRLGWSSLLVSSSALLGLVGLVGCNSITGANDLVIGEKSTSGGQGGASTGVTDVTGVVGAGAGSVASTGASTGDVDPTTTSTSDTGATSTTSTTSTTATTGTGNPTGSDAVGVSINEIAIYQGTKRDLMSGGNVAQSNIPIVANRQALVRVFVTTDGSYNGQPVTASISLNGQTFTGTGTAQNGSEASLGSTINIDIPQGALPASASWHLDLLQSGSNAVNPAAHFPASGDTTMPSQSSGAALKIKIVPVAYGADGSHRVPDTSASGLQAIHDRYLAIYPVPDVQISVRAAFAWNQSVDAQGNGWDELLSAVTDLHSQDGASSDTYYYGMFLPSADINAFCGSGCVAGLGNIAGASDGSQRAAIGLGYPEFADTTASHETGHNHGRQHADCGGATGIDPNYPYGGASIGVWGYDILAKKLYSPSSTTDMMGYCDPTWESDYTFDALFSRIKTVNGAQIIYPPDQMDKKYMKVRVDGLGGMRWSTKAIELHEPPIGTLVHVIVETKSGTVDTVGHYFALDHLEGGFVYIAADDSDVAAITMDFNGQSYRLKN